MEILYTALATMKVVCKCCTMKVHLLVRSSSRMPIKGSDNIQRSHIWFRIPPIFHNDSRFQAKIPDSVQPHKMLAHWITAHRIPFTYQLNKISTSEKWARHQPTKLLTNICSCHQWPPLSLMGKRWSHQSSRDHNHVIKSFLLKLYGNNWI